MKIKGIFIFAAIVLICSCGPNKYAVSVEMRNPSRSGVNLAGKIVSVVYAEGDDEYTNEFAASIADGFAYTLENDYGTGEGSVGIYKIRSSENTSYSSRDSLINLLVDTGADVVFLLEHPSISSMTVSPIKERSNVADPDSIYVTRGSMPYSLMLHCYDAMDKSEKVHTFTGSNIAYPKVYFGEGESSVNKVKKAYSALQEDGWNAGVKIADPFKTQWKHEQYSLIYFDSQKWYRSIEMAANYEWKEAVEAWIGFLDTHDMLRKASAEYNIAVACLMLGDAKLALEWLDRSDSDNKLPVSDALRKRINERL